jgi:glycine/D-amino acid oxidase-like deaminating enzyme
MDRRLFIEVCAGLSVAARLRRLEAQPVPRRIVVAGGGIIGASIAYHLARRGASVTLCEKQHPAAGATSKSFAWINAGFSKQPRSYFDLNRLGMAAWLRLERELAGELKVQWGGSVEWYPPGAEAELLHRGVRRHQEWGYAAHLVDAAELRRLVPGLEAGPVAAASFSEGEGAVDPVHAVEALLAQARLWGAHIVHPCEVTGLDLAARRVRAVMTTAGMFEVDTLVLACGVDTSRVAALAGVAVPLKDSHVTQRLDGRIVTGSSFGGSAVTDTGAGYGQHLLHEAARFLPALADAPLERVTLGWRVMPKDEYPIVGFVDACPNLYVPAMHSGVTLAPLVGQRAATEILDAVAVDLLQTFRLTRFA